MRDHIPFWLTLGAALFVSLLGVSSGEPLTLVSAAVAGALLLSLYRGHRRDSSSSQRAGLVAAPHPEERCRRGAFRRQSQPDAPGRALPRAPQHA